MTDTTPAPTRLRPTDLKEVRDAVLDSAGALGVVGAGTAAGWAGTPAPVDAVLDLAGLTGIIVHNPGDMTVAVRAGTALRDLNAELAEHGQHVAFDAARVADGATLGGLLSTGDAGPGAIVYGTLRDLVIGATMVLADGTVARSGGHVIKNVAGYDLTKLVHGAYGTLAVVAEVVLRLHPLPRAVATVVLPCTLDEVAGHAARVLGSPVEPAALEWVSDPVTAPAGPDGDPDASASTGTLLVRLEGTDAALPARVERLRELLGAGAEDASAAAARPTAAARGGTAPDGARGGIAPDGVDVGATPATGGASGTGPAAGDAVGATPAAGANVGTGPAAGDAVVGATPPTGGAGPPAGRVVDGDAWSTHARLTRGTLDDMVLRLGVRPSRLPEVLRALAARSVTAGLGTGVATVVLPPEPDAVQAAHATVHAAGGTSVLRHRPAGSAAPAWGPAPSALPVLRALKRTLDPSARLEPGRFAPWF